MAQMFGEPSLVSPTPFDPLRFVGLKAPIIVPNRQH
jgi:hypothetical protein